MKSIIVNKQNFIHKVIFITICLFGIILTYFANNEKNPFFIIGISTTIELILFLVYIYLLKRKISFSMIFVVLLYVFQFGQVAILAFYPKLIVKYSLRIVLLLFNTNDCINGLRIMNIAFVTLIAGIIINTRKNDTNFKKQNDNLEYINKLQIYSKNVIFMTFPIKLIIDLILFYKSFTLSFTSASLWYQSVPGFIKTYGGISLIGFCMLIISLKNDYKRQKRLMIIIVMYLLLLMLSGWRSENVAYLVIIGYMYISNCKKKFNYKSAIFYTTIAIFILTVLYTTVSIRFSNDRSLYAYYTLFTRVLFGDKNVIIESLREYGNTGYTTLIVLSKWLPSYSPSYGKSYFYGLFAIFPNFTGLAGKLSYLSSFAIELQEKNVLYYQYKNIGGSILGEFFFNFGIIGGIVISFIVGLFIGKISENVNNLIDSEKYYKLVYYIPIMFALTFWIRDMFTGNIRDVVWGILFCWILNKTKFHIKEEK